MFWRRGNFTTEPAARNAAIRGTRATAIYELVMSEAIRPLILNREASSVIGQVAVNEGMRSCAMMAGKR